ncbi:hypothetical protein LI90_2790 [Carbonactinospora thermoautotrophica]|uniref:Uncharacterized protein n=1 Tax=Carbonactinospora thermoautotrophica TaxID=1469144 RepID=A0A132MV24_9ACTN|nr:hypothetical protein LI90_2790 [Carbonactinospora thermoautotrophica]
MSHALVMAGRNSHTRKTPWSARTGRAWQASPAASPPPAQRAAIRHLTRIAAIGSPEKIGHRMPSVVTGLARYPT